MIELGKLRRDGQRMVLVEDGDALERGEQQNGYIVSVKCGSG